MKSLGSTDLKRLHREWRRRTEGRVALLLDNVATPFNVGSILRTAAALRVEEVWLAGSTADPHHERTRKTALGSDRFLTFHRVEQPHDAVAAARAAGYRVVGLELADDAVPLHEADLAGDVCLVVGHEDRGLTADSFAGCDQVAFIPQLGRIGSLNVATATAIALYEVRRRAWTG
ncbi:MAG: rRNA methyltransferase [Acidimicrobiales bacterium]|nr:rRNA methyltransferase [Acidimicrobiales bacterium]